MDADLTQGGAVRCARAGEGRGSRRVDPGERARSGADCAGRSVVPGGCGADGDAMATLPGPGYAVGLLERLALEKRPLLAV